MGGGRKPALSKCLHKEIEKLQNPPDVAKALDAVVTYQYAVQPTAVRELRCAMIDGRGASAFARSVAEGNFGTYVEVRDRWTARAAKYVDDRATGRVLR